MSHLTRRMRHTVTIQTPGELESSANEDDYGNQNEADLAYYDTYQARALVVPTVTSEDDTDRDTQGQTFDLYLQPLTRITGNSLVAFDLEENREVRGRVVGEPRIIPAATRGLAHKVATVEVVEG